MKMRRFATHIGTALATLVLALLAGCANWTQTREQLVNPIHELLHHRYPASYKDGDPEALAALFASPEAAGPSLALRASFAEVMNAHADIERVDLETRPIRGRVTLRLDGTGLDGQPRTIHQDRTMTVEATEAGWKVLTDAPDALVETPRPGAFFYDESQLRGLWFRHQGKPIAGPDGEPNRYVFGSGVAAADLDGNGFDDVVLASGGRIELFLNQGGYFERRSEAWGLGDALPEPGDGVWTVLLPRDFDGDGQRDLFVGAEFAQPILLRNTGSRFVPVADTGIVSSERTIAAAAADFDGDGNLDLYLANHEDVFRKAPDLPYARNARLDQLFLGNGDGTFRDATRAAGLDNTGWSLDPVAADYDGDGDVDLFIGNDFGTDTLLRNDGHAHFEDVADEAGVDRPIASMSADWGDFDGDGDLDLFVGGMASGSGWVLEVPQFQIRKVPWIVDALFRPYVRDAVRAWFRGNRLYQNRGDGTFEEIAAAAGVQRNGWAWGSVWLDFDNDGRLDVYAANGFLSGPRKDDL